MLLNSGRPLIYFLKSLFFKNLCYKKMIENKFTPKIRYVDTQPPHSVGGDDNISPLREFFSYSDTDYEYLIYRTRGRDFHSSKNRSTQVDHYHREESNEDNNFNLGGEDDYQTLFDDENVLFDFPDEIDAAFKPSFFFTEIIEFFNEYVYDRFFYSNSHAQLALYYFLSFYFYFFEYVWPIVCLYFPFLDYSSIFFIFGWDSILEQHFFPFLFTLYLPFFVYFFFHWRFSAHIRFSAYLSFFRFGLIFFTVFFACVFAPIHGFFFLVFLPPLFLSFFLSFFLPFLDSQARVDSFEDFYGGYTRFLLPPPSRIDFPRLPIYFYSYTKFPPINLSDQAPKRLNFTRFPFFNIKPSLIHIKRVRLVQSYQISPNRLFNSSIIPHNFPYLQPFKKSGFLFDHFPVGFGYSAESHVMLEGFTKESSIEFDNESGMRPDNYTMDFMTNELGVSNVRFFLSESYHPPINYSVNFNNSADALGLYSPRSFSRESEVAFGPYYQLSVWLILIKPQNLNLPSSTSFDSLSHIPSTLDYGNFIRSALVAPFSRTSLEFVGLNHTFFNRFYVTLANSFYSFVHYCCLRFFGFYLYNFSKINEPFRIASDFFYVFSTFYLRIRLFKEFFRFMIFIAKNHKSKKLSVSTLSSLVPLLVTLLGLLVKLELFYKNSFFRNFYKKHLKYARLCRIELTRLVKQLTF